MSCAYATATARGEAACSTKDRPAAPLAASAAGSAVISRTAATNAAASSGGTTRPAPDATIIRGTSVPASTAASTGRPAARIEYVFDGTLTLPESGAQWHHVEVARGEHLGQPLLRLEADEANVGQSCRLLLAATHGLIRRR